MAACGDDDDSAGGADAGNTDGAPPDASDLDSSLPDAGDPDGDLPDAGDPDGDLPDGGGNTSIPGTPVGAEGATLTSDAVSVTVPAGALDSEVSIAVTQIDGAGVAALPEATAPGVEGVAELSPEVFAFTPHGTTFATPVTIELSYVGTRNALLRLDDELDETWELVDAAEFAGGQVQFEATGFSIYAVASVTRECKRQFCLDLAGTVQCGIVDDTCGGQTDVNAECGRPPCASGSCGVDNTCLEFTCTPTCPADKTCRAGNVCGEPGCISTFDCETTTAQCGTETDNCGVDHDVAAECDGVTGCDNGTCTDINLCSDCTPHADCAAALAAFGGSCSASVGDGCGGIMDCPTCPDGQTCFFIEDEYAEGGGYDACRIPCAGVSDCPAGFSECRGSEHWVESWRCEAGKCEGLGGYADCGPCGCGPWSGGLGCIPTC